MTRSAQAMPVPDPLAARSATGDLVQLRTAVLAWFAISLRTFGGPAGQIAVMHRELVDERRWIGEIHVTGPVWSAVSPRALFVTVLAFVLVFRLKLSVLRVLAICAAVGAALYLAAR